VVQQRYGLAPDVDERVARRLLASPGLADALPQQPLTSDAELAPGLLGELFADVELEPWDAPLLVLPSPEALRGYLLGKGSDRAAAQAAVRSHGRPVVRYQARRPGVCPKG
jgi:hypothetical protein